MARHHPFLMPLSSTTGTHQIYELLYPFVSPGVATSILKHSMMKIKQGQILALAHFKTKQNVLNSGL
jgi:hypothetical protein